MRIWIKKKEDGSIFFNFLLLYSNFIRKIATILEKISYFQIHAIPPIFTHTFLFLSVEWCHPSSSKSKLFPYA